MKLGYFAAPPGVNRFMDFIDIAKEHGLGSLELYGSREFAPGTPPEQMERSARDVRARAEEAGIVLACFSMYADIVGEKRKETVALLKQYARVCQITGCPYLHHTIAIDPPCKIKMPFSETLRRAVESIREIYDYAEQLGVKCCYEDQGYVFNGCDRFDLLLSEVNREVGVVADLGNILYADETPERFVGRFLPYIVHVHLKDYLLKSGGGPNPGEGWVRTQSGNYLRNTVIGHGVVDFERVFGLLISGGYDGYLHLECSGPEDPRVSVRLNIENARRFYENAERACGTEKK